MSSPTDKPAWQKLKAHSAQFQQADYRLTHLFESAPDRFSRFSLQLEHLLLDYSKNLVTEQTLDLLIELAEQQQLPAAIAAMFAGDKINNSEQRPALHIALREPTEAMRFREVAETLTRMEKLVARVHSGDWRGYSGKQITDIVNLGVGGSDLGPALVVSALQHRSVHSIRAHFVSNIDPIHIDSVITQLNPETTLFIVASKSFTTLETLHNAQTARAWIAAGSEDTAKIAQHFVAVTSNVAAAQEFGITANHVFPMWDWVGGRYSLWSAIGLPIAFVIGMDGFRQLLAGAHAMDEHFRHAELHQNMPVILALLTVWYRAFFASHSTAVVPYSQALRLLPAFLQQLSMESLGKSVDREHRPVSTHTGEPIWGSVGTDVQHSCFQLLHQGTDFIPVDFIACARSTVTGDDSAQEHLLANCFSQSLALMQGHRDAASPFRDVAGNKPSNTLLLADLDPYNLGSLLALYEHKIFVQSVIWDINAFDQWGVELGKQLSQELFSAISAPARHSQLDDSTRNLIAFANDWKN